MQAPVCAPSRSCLASGREYDHAGVPNNFHNDYNISIPTFYSQLREAGIQSGGPRPVSEKDRSRFLSRLDEAVSRSRRTR